MADKKRPTDEAPKSDYLHRLIRENMDRRRAIGTMGKIGAGVAAVAVVGGVAAYLASQTAPAPVTVTQTTTAVQTKTATATTTSVLTTSATSVSAAPTIEFDYLFWFDPEIKFALDYVAQFEKNTGIKVNAQQLPTSSFREDVLAKISTGSAPDMMHLYRENNLVELVGIGAVAPLDQYVTPDLKDDMTKALWDPVTFGDKIMAIPGPVIDGMVLYWNKELFQKAGLDSEKAPTTWEQMSDYAEKLTTTLPDGTKQYGIGWRCTGPEWVIPESLLSVLAANDVYLLVQGSDGKWKTGLDTSAAHDALDYYLHFANTGTAPREMVGWIWSNVVEKFDRGQLGMMIGGTWFGPQLKSLTKDQWGMAKIPAPSNKPQNLGKNYDHSHCFWISAQSKHKDEAWKLLDWMMRPDFLIKDAVFEGVATPRTSANKDPQITNDPILNFVATQLADQFVAPPKHPNYLQLNTLIVTPTIQDAIAGKITTDQAIDIINSKVPIVVK